VIDNFANQKRMNEGADDKLGQQLRHMYNSAPAKDANGKAAEVNGGDIMFIQDSPDIKRVNIQENDTDGVKAGAIGADHSDEPMIKIQNQNQSLNKSKGLHSSNNQGISSADIRQIKLNYIQLNKRATTASNNGIGRKIPQKNQQN